MSFLTGSSKELLGKLLKLAANNPKAIIGTQRITIDNTVQSLTVPANANYAIVTVESNATGIAVRYLESGETPVATTLGRPLYDRTAFDIADYQNLIRAKFTEEASHTTYLNVEYYNIQY